MGRGSTLVASAISGWLLCGLSIPVGAQPTAPHPLPASHGVRAAQKGTRPGSIDGRVWDERGRPLSGVVITVMGSGTTFVVTNDQGRFEVAALPPGPYLVRALAPGYPSRSQRVVVRAEMPATSLFAMRRSDGSSGLLTAGLGSFDVPDQAVPQRTDGDSSEAAADPADQGRQGSETAWRLRHARRGVLKDSSFPSDLVADGREAERARVVDLVGRAMSSPARMATSFFADTHFTGQVHLLTSSLFESPEQLLTSAPLARGIAHVKVSAPAGAGDWTVRGALTQADIASWIVAGTYRTREERRHRYQLGLSYSTQAYGGGHPLTLRELTDGSRNAGELFGFDTFAVTTALSVTYGARYQHYDYLEQRGLFSPSVAATLSASESLRFGVSLSSRGDAPGAGEFVQPNDEGIWLPPQRTFSAADPGTPFRASRTRQIAGQVERDFGPSTVALKAFRQEVDSQLVTIFGAELPNFEGVKLGHYFVGAAGDARATGGSVAVRSSVAGRVNGSVTYSVAAAQLLPPNASRYVLLLAPVATRPSLERLHDLTTAIDAAVPETSTKILVVYRVGNGYARPVSGGRPADAATTGVDSRFDVQVRQSLPFLNFTNARWEMLVAVRNFLRETELDQSIYDELLTVRPPKRIVGGVTLHF